MDIKCFNNQKVLGPALSDNVGSSVNHILKLLNATVEKVPNIYYPTCDVRDVVIYGFYLLLHILLILYHS